MGKTHEAVKHGLSGRKNGKGEKGKLHTHGVHYERAHNGGVIAHVHRHTAEGLHHSEEHVLPDMDAAHAHLDEHMGDQPGAGEVQSAAQVPPQEPEGDEGGGGGAMPPQAGM
jgi:hypothetical protein